MMKASGSRTGFPGVQPAIRARMARIKKCHTKPELLVRRCAHRLGYRFRLHRADLPGTPDIVFSGPPEGHSGERLQAELERLWRRLQPLATDTISLEVPPPRTSRFGSPLVLSRVHWVRPELVAEVKFLTWTDDNLLRQVVYEGLREDKPAAEVRRPVPHPKPGTPGG
jgi:hypothetical protein